MLLSVSCDVPKAPELTASPHAARSTLGLSPTNRRFDGDLGSMSPKVLASPKAAVAAIREFLVDDPPRPFSRSRSRDGHQPPLEVRKPSSMTAFGVDPSCGVRGAPVSAGCLPAFGAGGPRPPHRLSLERGGPDLVSVVSSHGDLGGRLRRRHRCYVE